MATYEFTGRVEDIKPVQTFKSGFEKQEIVVTDESEPQYPNSVAFQFLKHKLALVSKIRLGDIVTIVFSVGGREWNGRHFTDLIAHDVYGAVGQAPQVPAPPPPQRDDPNDPTTWHNQQPSTEETEELPF